MRYPELRKALKDKGMSIRKLAIEASIVPQSLYSAINGNTPFWPGWRKRVAEVLGVDEAVIFPEVNKHDC